MQEERMVKSLWHNITASFRRITDEQQTKDEADVELALNALSYTRLFPHDPNHPEEQRLAIGKALAFLGHPKSRRTGEAMNRDEAMTLLDTLDPWRRAQCTPRFSAEDLGKAQKDGDEWAFWTYMKELEGETTLDKKP